MNPLLMSLIPTIVQVVGDHIRGYSKVVDAGLDMIQKETGQTINRLSDMKIDESVTPALSNIDSLFRQFTIKELGGLTPEEAKDLQQTRDKMSDKSYKTQIVFGIILFAIATFIIFIMLSPGVCIEEKGILGMALLVVLMMCAKVIKFFFG